MSHRGAGETHPFELVAGVALAGLALVGLCVWLIGGVAGVLFGAGWPRVGAGDVAGVLFAVPDHLADPRSAWPPAARADLPSATGMYAALALVLFGVALAVGLTMRVTTGLTHAKGGARWAQRRDLAPLLVRSSQSGRLTLGRHGSRLVAVERGHSALVIAPTQTGKTTALAIPAVLEWQGPVLATSVKTDLLRDTITARAHMGRVELFDPGDSTGLASASWSPLAGCMTWAGARRTAGWLTDGASPAKHSISDGDFWYTAAAKLLAPILYAAATSGRTMGEVVAWIDRQEEAEVLDALDETACEEALSAMRASWLRDDRQRSSIYTTAETVLEAYADPGVLAHSEVNDISAEDFLGGGIHTLFLSATVREQRRLRPVFVALIETVLEKAYALAAATGKPLDPPLLVVLDEAANIAPLPDLDVIAATGAGHGVHLLTVLQDLAQAHERWGRDRADTILNNHRAKVIGTGISDERTLDYVARLLGDSETPQQSTTRGEHGRRSTTDSTTYRPIAPGHSLREGKPGSALLVYGGLPPAWIRLRPWYRDRRLRSLATPASAPTPAGPRLGIDGDL